MDNVKTVRTIIKAFIERDIPLVLSHLAEDVDWEYGSLVDVPWYTPRTGKEDAAKFFESLQAVEFLQFEPKSYFGADDWAGVLLDSDYRLKSNGKRVVYEDLFLIFRFNAEGKVARFAHRVDMHQAWLAYHAKASDSQSAA
jgi:uncharacterized protein